MKFGVRILICILLVGLVFIVFGQTIGYGFINYDDGEYVYENPMVAGGLSLESIEWAFTHVVSGHWHPVTILLLMTECQFFGMWAGGFHLVNLILHAASVILLFLILGEITGAPWRSAFVAAVFAIHPLRAESVVWISECKDVLSGLFFMLTLRAYVRYVRSGGRYWPMLLWLALGLMSKPMLVTLPCVLLLLDYWPLRRLQSPAQFPKLFLEKAPLFILSALSGVAAVVALKATPVPTKPYPANIPIAYVAYLSKLFYPVHLALIYPFPKAGTPVWELFNAILILVLVTLGAWLLRRKRPYVITGWLWYLGVLVPVIGVLQGADHAYADRYTYLPQIGIYLAVTWMVADLLRNRFVPLAVIAAPILCVLSLIAMRQTTYWRDSVTLWRHAIECTRDNFLAHNNLGNALLQQGHAQEAVEEYRDTLQINPAYPGGHDDLGNALLKLGRVDEAIAECRKALQIEPSDRAISIGPDRSSHRGVSRHAAHCSRLHRGPQ
jgi:protein O-mannosyl-transferase